MQDEQIKLCETFLLHVLLVIKPYSKKGKRKTLKNAQNLIALYIYIERSECGDFKAYILTSFRSTAHSRSLSHASRRETHLQVKKERHELCFSFPCLCDTGTLCAIHLQ